VCDSKYLPRLFFVIKFHLVRRAQRFLLIYLFFYIDSFFTIVPAEQIVSKRHINCDKRHLSQLQVKSQKNRLEVCSQGIIRCESKFFLQASLILRHPLGINGPELELGSSGYPQLQLAIKF